MQLLIRLVEVTTWSLSIYKGPCRIGKEACRNRREFALVAMQSNLIRNIICRGHIYSVVKISMVHNHSPSRILSGGIVATAPGKMSHARNIYVDLCVIELH
jgi:hypothetical protein